MAVVMPEEVAGMLARNPEIAARNPELVDKVRTAMSATSAVHKAASKAAPAQTRAAAKTTPARSTLDSLNSAGAQLDKLPGRIPGRSGILPRLIIAVFAGIFTLELVSQMTGQYFKYNLNPSAAKAKTAASPPPATHSLGLV